MNNNQNNQNNMDYSFDFANQVDNQPVQPSEQQNTMPVQEAPVEPIVSTIETPVQGNQNAEQVENQNVETVPTNDEPAQEEQSEEELIKDKKATKNFLIILTVLIAIFIIALPFIQNLIG